MRSRATRPVLAALLVMTALPPAAVAGTWTQTTPADFQAGSGTNVDLTSASGRVVPASSSSAWWDPAWSYRLRVDISAGASARTDLPLELEFDLPALLAGAGIPGTVDPDSIRWVEFNATTSQLVGELPSHYEHSTLGGKGVLVSSLTGTTPAETVRSFHLYFDVLESGPKPRPSYRSSVATEVLENTQLRLAGINRDGAGRVAPLGIRDAVLLSSGADTLYVRYTKVGSSLGTWGTPIQGYSGCGQGGKQTCKISDTNYGTALSAPTQVVTHPELKVNRVIVPAGPLRLTQLISLTTGAEARIYTRVENTGGTVAAGAYYWEGGDQDILGTSSTDDSGDRFSDGSLFASDSATPAAVGLRGTGSPSAWDLQDRMKVMDAIYAESPGNQTRLQKGDVGFGLRFGLGDIPAGGFATLRSQYALGADTTGPQQRLASLALLTFQTRYPLLARCNAGEGTFLSSVFDSAAAGTLWNQLSFTRGLPAGAELLLQTRTGEGPVPDASWSPFGAEHTNPSGEAIVSPPGRYLQYRAVLRPSPSGGCPSLDTVQVTFTTLGAQVASFEVAGHPSPSVAGGSHPVTITAKALDGTTADSYTGTVLLSSSDPAASLPASVVFGAADQGTVSVPVTLRTAGTQQLRAEDASGPALNGTQSGLEVQPDAPAALELSGFPAELQAGTSGSFQVRAVDAFGNLCTGYQGTVRFSCSDSSATLPAEAAFTATHAGVRSFEATLVTAQVHTLSVDDLTAGFGGSQSGIVVHPGPAASFEVSGYPSPTPVATPQPFTVTALDAWGNVATEHQGELQVTSTDPAASLPSAEALGAGDKGGRTLTASFGTPGTHELVVSDSSAREGRQAGILVQAMDGAGCTADTQCATGFCSQGVCCAERCDGPCRGCALPGQEGTCSPQPDGSACGDGAFCNGAETCQAGACLPGSAISCQEGEGWVCDESLLSCIQPPQPLHATVGCGCASSPAALAAPLLLLLLRLPRSRSPGRLARTRSGTR